MKQLLSALGAKPEQIAEDPGNGGAEPQEGFSTPSPMPRGGMTDAPQMVMVGEWWRARPPE